MYLMDNVTFFFSVSIKSPELNKTPAELCFLVSVTKTFSNFSFDPKVIKTVLQIKSLQSKKKPITTCSWCLSTSM